MLVMSLAAMRRGSGPAFPMWQGAEHRGHAGHPRLDRIPFGRSDRKKMLRPLAPSTLSPLFVKSDIGILLL